MIIDHDKEKLVQSRFHFQVSSWVKATLFVVIVIAVSVLFMLPAMVSADTPTAIVHITGSARPPGFTPSFRTIYVNTSVTFINDAYPPAPYTIVAKDGSFTSPTLAPSQQWTVTVKSIGNYEYTTQEAPRQMAGDLIVVGLSDTLVPTPNPTAQAALINQVKNGGNTQSPSSTFQLGVPTWAFVVVALLVIGTIASIFILLGIRSKRLQP